MEQDEDEIQK